MQRTLRHPGFWLAVGLSVLVVVLQMVVVGSLHVLDLLVAQLTGLMLHLVSNTLVIGCVNLVAIGAVITLALVINKQPPRGAFPLGPIAGTAWLALPLVVCGGAILLSEADNAFRWLCPPPETITQVMSKMILAEGRWFSQVFTLVIVAPLTEELLCRGILLRGLLRRHRPAVAVALSAMLFALIHLNPWQMISAFVLGLVFGWFYLRTGSLWPCIAGHALHNGIVTLAVAAPFGLWEPPTAADWGRVAFQPWLMDAGGVGLLVLGLWLFRRSSSAPVQEVCPELPPILCSSDVPPSPPAQSA